MILGRDCRPHQGLFGVWPNEPCPWHDDADPTKGSVLVLKDHANLFRTSVEMEVLASGSGLSIANCHFHKGFVYNYMRPFADKPCEVMASTFDKKVQFHGNWLKAQNCCFREDVYLSGSNIYLIDCVFEGDVWFNDYYPTDKYFISRSVIKLGVTPLDFEAKNLHWW